MNLNDTGFLKFSGLQRVTKSDQRRKTLGTDVPGRKNGKKGAKGKEVKKEKKKGRKKERNNQNLKFEGVKSAFPAV